MAPVSFNEFTAIEEVGPGQFRSKGLPQSSGNTAMAYGGFALAVAVRAAYAALPTGSSSSSSSSSHALYSLLGHYLGPTLTSAPLECAVIAVRTTRAFATRRVEAQPDGSTRRCLEVLADFHAREPRALLTYSAPPARTYAGPADQPEGLAERAGTEGGGAEEKEGVGMATPGLARELTALTERYFETRPCREGVAYQNHHGSLKHVRTTQEDLAPTARTAAEWQRWRRANDGDDDDDEGGLKTPADQAAAAAFLLDGGLAYLPMTLHHAWFDDVTASSSLDVALRFLTPALDLAAWHLRERTSPAAGAGRSYTEARLWDGDGTLVAIMTQQGILRPAAGRPAAKI